MPEHPARAWEVGAKGNPFAVGAGDLGFVNANITLAELSTLLKDTYQADTVRRYITDLRRYRLIERSGYGADAKLKIALPAVRALARNSLNWQQRFRGIFERLGKIQQF